MQVQVQVSPLVTATEAAGVAQRRVNENLLNVSTRSQQHTWRQPVQNPGPAQIPPVRSGGGKVEDRRSKVEPPLFKPQRQRGKSGESPTHRTPRPARPSLSSATSARNFFFGQQDGMLSSPVTVTRHFRSEVSK